MVAMITGEDDKCVMQLANGTKSIDKLKIVKKQYGQYVPLKLCPLPPFPLHRQHFAVSGVAASAFGQ
jgi:hypothetical protein